VTKGQLVISFMREVFEIIYGVTLLVEYTVSIKRPYEKQKTGSATWDEIASNPKASSSCGTLPILIFPRYCGMLSQYINIKQKKKGGIKTKSNLNCLSLNPIIKKETGKNFADH
jgi:hypothetical protein